MNTEQRHGTLPLPVCNCSECQRTRLLRSLEDLMQKAVKPPMLTVTKQFRHRVNAATSVKGVVTWDCTVEGEGFTQEEILAEHDKLVAALRARYSVVVDA